MVLDTPISGNKSIAKIILEHPEYLQKLPKAEQDLYDLYINHRMGQKEIANLLGMTQGAVSSRLTRARKRLDFLLKLEGFDFNNLYQDLSKIFNEFELCLLQTMCRTTCQTETAQILNDVYGFKGNKKMNQVKVRHRFCNCLKKMEKTNSKYYELFFLINKNPYILHEVRLPHFEASYAR